MAVWCWAMEPRTHDLWSRQNQHEGDRWRLFTSVHNAIGGRVVLYPGSFVDIAASFVFPEVTYVDTDRRAASFFADEAGVREIIAAHASAPEHPAVQFIHRDYRERLGLPDGGFDLLLSLYAGFVSEHCTVHLRIGGTLLANPSHGDAAMASIDPRYELAGVVTSRAGDYRVSTKDLDTYLHPKLDVTPTPALLHTTGRGIAYTRSPFAYLFRRVE